jgi:autotransporter-associated beta strand protein
VEAGEGNSFVPFTGGKLQLSADQAALFNGFAPDRVTLNGAGGTIDTQGFTVATAQALTGDGALTKEGNGSLTLTGANTFTGGTTVAEGTLQIGNGGTSGSVVGNIVNNGALVFNRSDALTYAGILSGTGSLTKNGAGVLTLTNQNTYAGTTAVNAGTLAIDGAVNGPGGLVTVANGATLGGSGKLYRDVSVGATGQISSLLKVFGEVTLGNQANVGDVSSGTITADAGQQLVIGNATGGTINTTAGTASIATLNGASLTTGNLGATIETLVAGNITTNGGALVAKAGSFSGAISGGGGLTKAGPGTLTLTGASDYTGGTFVAGGLILVNNSIGSGLGTGEVAVGGGGTLGGGGIISGPTAIGSGGTLAPGNSPGLLTLGSSLTLAGGSTSVFEINGAGRGTTYDAIDVAGLTTYGGTLSLVFGSTIAGGTTLDLFGLGGGEVESFSAITASGDYTGAFVNNSGIWTLLNGGQTLTFTESSGDLLVMGVAVPEPSAAAALAGVGTLAFAALRRRRAK